MDACSPLRYLSTGLEAAMRHLSTVLTHCHALCQYRASRPLRTQSQMYTSSVHFVPVTNLNATDFAPGNCLETRPPPHSSLLASRWPAIARHRHVSYVSTRHRKVRPMPVPEIKWQRPDQYRTS
eukprot:1273206-Rhodomonas_salina.1